MRIPKYFSQNKILSRREAEKLLRSGRIKLNGQIVKDVLTEVNPTDKLEIVGDLKPKLTVLFYKPRGINTPDVFDLVPQFKHLNTIGRLDKESEGLILLSNDGVIAKSVTGADHLTEKEYLVEVSGKVTPEKINKLSQGMLLEDGPTLPAPSKLIDDHIFSIVLKEGRNHQIRRMANQLRLSVLSLTRVRIGQLKIKNLQPGEYRILSQQEIQNIKDAPGA